MLSRYGEGSSTTLRLEIPRTLFTKMHKIVRAVFCKRALHVLVSAISVFLVCLFWRRSLETLDEVMLVQGRHGGFGIRSVDGYLILTYLEAQIPAKPLKVYSEPLKQMLDRKLFFEQVGMTVPLHEHENRGMLGLSILIARPPTCVSIGIRYWLIFSMVCVACLCVTCMRYARAWRRRRRRRCVECGYDLRGCISDRCPECGNPLADQTCRCQ